MVNNIQAWSERLASWAQDKSMITQLWLYGSRVRGDHKCDSDLDVAVLLEGDQQTRSTNWICESADWSEELNDLLPVKVHLEVADEENAPINVVKPAIEKEGRCIFSRYGKAK